MRSAGQVVSAQLGEHVSSSTLSAHQMARAGEPVDSSGSDVWVRLHEDDTDQSNFWNRRTRETTWRGLVGVQMSAGKVLWYWNQSLVSLHMTNMYPVLNQQELNTESIQKSSSRKTHNLELRGRTPNK